MLLVLTSSSCCCSKYHISENEKLRSKSRLLSIVVWLFLVELYLQYVGHVSDSVNPCDSHDLVWYPPSVMSQKMMHELKWQKQIEKPLSWVYNQCSVSSSCHWVHRDGDHVIHVSIHVENFTRDLWESSSSHSHTHKHDTQMQWQAITDCVVVWAVHFHSVEIQTCKRYYLVSCQALGSGFYMLSTDIHK